MDFNFGDLDFGTPVDRSKDIIKIVGVGGGGCNAVKNMYEEDIENVTYAVCNTDTQSLVKMPITVKLQLGKEGLGAGGNPEVGRQETEQSLDNVKKLFSDGTKMTFVTAGMGGGTGTGAAPLIAGVAKSMGILTVGVVTIPFYFEKKRKIIKALKGVEEMRRNVDALLIVNNERLCNVYGDSDIAVKEAFKRADNILKDAVKSIAELITVEGDINLDFRDVETTMLGGGGALMAMGRASGERRVADAILNALDSPLLYGSDISKAKRILFNIYTGTQHPLGVKELNEIDAFMDELNPDIDVIWGVSDDDTLDDEAKVAILATGLDNTYGEPVSEHKGNDNEYYDDIINRLYISAAAKNNAKKVERQQPVVQDYAQNNTAEATVSVNETSNEGVGTGKSAPQSVWNGREMLSSFAERVRKRMREFTEIITKGDDE